MQRRAKWFLAVVVAVFIFVQLIFFGVLSGAQPKRQGPPNVVLVTIDRLRWDRLSCLSTNSPGTPNIDALAARGALFEKCYAQAELTPTSHMAILTSSYPFETYKDTAQKRHRTLAEMLRAAGYHTASFPSTAILNPTEFNEVSMALNFGMGFDEVAAIPMEPGKPLFFVRRKGRDTNDLALKWLADPARQGKPWFLFLNYRDGHPPIELPAPWMPAASGSQFDERVDVYDAAVRYMDSLVGEIMSALKRRGFEDNTAIALVGDHGWNANVGRPEGFNEGTVHVPMILSWPGGPRGTRVTEVAETIDAVPTLLSVAGVNGERLSGQDRTKPPKRALAFSQTTRSEGFMVTDGRWKYIHFARTLNRPGFFVKKGTTELYDLSSDPGETRNLAGRNSDEEIRLRYYLAMRFTGDGGWPGKPDPAVLKRMKTQDYF